MVGRLPQGEPNIVESLNGMWIAQSFVWWLLSGWWYRVLSGICGMGNGPMRHESVTKWETMSQTIDRAYLYRSICSTSTENAVARSLARSASGRSVRSLSVKGMLSSSIPMHSGIETCTKIFERMSAGKLLCSSTCSIRDVTANSEGGKAEVDEEANMEGQVYRLRWTGTRALSVLEKKRRGEQKIENHDRCALSST